MVERLASLPMLGFSVARSLQYTALYQLLNLPALLLQGRPLPDPELQGQVWQDLYALLRQDVSNIEQGLYPARVLFADSPFEPLRMLPRVLLDGLSLAQRRLSGEAHAFDADASEYLDEIPPYARHNFHFQTNGYLSERSAELYDFQVELLFGGAADAMRRLIVPALKAAFPGEGQGRTFLEVGAGTGRATRFVQQAFPKAKIVVSDLSPPYLKIAQKKLAAFPRVDFIQANSALLPFQDAQFDAVYSVFLLHELPLHARKATFAEGRRVLRSGGLLGCVDSVQTDDVACFNPLLEQFPRDFYEPFYQEYLAHPVEPLLADAAFGPVQSTRGFFSKACWTIKE